MLGFLAGLWLARRRAPRFGLNAEQITDVAFWVLFAGILGARIAFILVELPYYLRHPSEILELRFQGLTSFGGLILGTAALFWQAKRRGISAMSLTDCIAPSFLIGHIFGRIGCLLNGCCYGGHCDLPWGIHVLDDSGIPLAGLYHPAQIYDSLMNLAGLGAFLLWIDRKQLKTGQATGFALLVYGLARFIYEFWRMGATSTTIGALPITEGHLFALATAILGAVLWKRAKGPSISTSEVSP